MLFANLLNLCGGRGMLAAGAGACEAGACEAGAWAARMAPTLNREAKISLFTLVLLLRGVRFRLA